MSLVIFYQFVNRTYEDVFGLRGKPQIYNHIFIHFKLQYVFGNDKPNWKMFFATRNHQN